MKFVAGERIVDFFVSGFLRTANSNAGGGDVGGEGRDVGPVPVGDAESRGEARKSRVREFGSDGLDL